MSQVSAAPVRLMFLYARIPPYLPTVLAALVESGSVDEIDVIHWESSPRHGNLYRPISVPSVTYTPRSRFDDEALIARLKHQQPRVVYVSGWMDKGYLRALRKYRKMASVTVVAGIDDQWEGTLRQRIGSIYFRLIYRSLIDVMWVAGGPQRVYASHFGYRGRGVIPHLLPADVDKLTRVAIGTSKRFLYLGRFVAVKGLDILLEAYKGLSPEIKKEWRLEIVGDGELRESLLLQAKGENVSMRAYVQPGDLNGLLSGGGVACFPSRHEQWGVAIHELAAAGFTIIASDVCGAASEFLIEGHNGFLCRTGEVESLRRVMEKCALMSNSERARFAQRSRNLSRRITPLESAAALLSLVDLPAASGPSQTLGSEP